MADQGALRLHPQVRLLLLFFLAVALPLQSLNALLYMLLPIALGCFINNGLSIWFQSVMRLKWLFISIALLYGWFTPGLPVVEVVSVNMPTREGLLLAAARALVLIVLVGAVTWLVKPLPANLLANSLSKLLSPLQHLGINIQRFSDRLAYTLALVANLQKRLSGQREQGWLASSGEVIRSIEAGELVAENDAAEVSSAREFGLADLLVLVSVLLVFSVPMFVLVV
ncbi:MAG: hypothetical protein OXT49_05675 [Gammaproteobacteria bacterium]|nr:hypothetical protein [Gammaproteobacteria bacterium]